ncbi:unnamed protein product [Anisakis simplex]|uniref:Craniofacial development protein 2-like n=1 Tax=Anisakis simplex TaxID=6269 RepID=A0A0M3K8X0_ANISI|nr:unnamed protein product [Anisakis simplex]
MPVELQAPAGTTKPDRLSVGAGRTITDPSPRANPAKAERTLKIVQVYAPATNNAQPTEEAEEELEEFFEEVERAMNKKSTYTIVQGDFNAKVGCRINQNERYIEKLSNIKYSRQFGIASEQTGSSGLVNNE